MCSIDACSVLVKGSESPSYYLCMKYFLQVHGFTMETWRAVAQSKNYVDNHRDMKGSDVPFNISLPLLGIGLLSLLLSLTFCCYMWRLRCKARQEQGYRRIKFKTTKKRKLPNDTCPVCIEEFEQSEYVAICPCNHCFHMKCLLEWLRYQNACPMCKAPVQNLPSPGERTGLVPIDRRTQDIERAASSSIEAV